MIQTFGIPAARGFHAGLLAALMSFAVAGDALAKCLPIAGLQRGFIRAALPAAGSVRLTYLGHSSFLIETSHGASAVTDYNGAVRPPELPDIVTMNNAHTTHYTDYVEPGIKFALRGWDPGGGVAVHDLVHEDLSVWNVTTNVREFGGVRYNGNSIFVFEAADLCIAHLGHLHQVLSDEHLEELGLIDVLLVPVDGTYTLAQEIMLRVIDQIGAPVIIPMHYFGGSSLTRFLALVEGRYKVRFAETSSVILSRLGLPYRTVLVMPPGQAFSSGFDD